MIIKLAHARPQNPKILKIFEKFFFHFFVFWSERCILSTKKNFFTFFHRWRAIRQGNPAFDHHYCMGGSPSREVRPRFTNFLLNIPKSADFEKKKLWKIVCVSIRFSAIIFVAFGSFFHVKRLQNLPLYPRSRHLGYMIKN